MCSPYRDELKGDMLTTMDIEKEITELKRRADMTDTRLARAEGQFEFVSGQLRDMQLYMHNRFGAIDDQFDTINDRFNSIDNRLSKIDNRFDAMERRFVAMESRFDGTDDKLDSIGTDVKALVSTVGQLVQRDGG